MLSQTLVLRLDAYNLGVNVAEKLIISLDGLSICHSFHSGDLLSPYLGDGFRLSSVLFATSIKQLLFSLQAFDDYVVLSI